MYIIRRLPETLALLALAILRSHAATVVNDLSFGFNHKVGDSGHVPGWQVGGDGYQPEVMSDRIILTPPYPGSKRSYAWTTKSATDTEWSVDIEFRVSGPERGSGNMQIWYAKDGQSAIGSSSIYTVGKFEGLVLLVDQYGGHGGSVRGFLNDGSKSLKDHHNLDSLAFGHCDFAYRNLGHFTHLNLKQTRDNFEVEIDGRQCFKTHKVCHC